MREKYKFCVDHMRTCACALLQHDSPYVSVTNEVQNTEQQTFAKQVT